MNYRSTRVSSETVRRSLPFLRVALLVLVLGGCAQPARYILVTDRSQVVYDAPDQRYICLSSADVDGNQAMLTLRTRADVQNYARQRGAAASPLSTVLFHVLNGDYARARVLLDKQKNSIAPYLALLLDADLTFENRKQKREARQIVEMYQAAFDVQTCDLNRDFIQARVRQVRYGL